MKGVRFVNSHKIPKKSLSHFHRRPSFLIVLQHWIISLLLGRYVVISLKNIEGKIVKIENEVSSTINWLPTCNWHKVLDYQGSGKGVLHAEQSKPSPYPSVGASGEFYIRWRKQLCSSWCPACPRCHSISHLRSPGASPEGAKSLTSRVERSVHPRRLMEKCWAYILCRGSGWRWSVWKIIKLLDSFSLKS